MGAMMQASEIMTREVVTVSPDTPTAEIARLLLAHGISAVPVVDASGMPIGMVSEGDLVGRSEPDRQARRDWWLSLVAEGEELHPDFLASLRRRDHTARDVMSAPVVRVTEGTATDEIARLLAAHHIKRVPVVRDGKIVGIVSRADLLRTLTAAPARAMPAEHVSRARNLLAEALATLDAHFLPHRPRREGAAQAPSAGAVESGLTVADFRGLVADFERRQAGRESEKSRAQLEAIGQRVRELIDRHIREDNWNALIQQARVAAEHGGKELLLLRFPSQLCEDAGRAINAALPDWPRTLRGEAAEIYLLWERDLKPRGFHLAARVLDFPHGMPGDIGLFLLWGE
jgi:CBS domain-containing protein